MKWFVIMNMLVMLSSCVSDGGNEDTSNEIDQDYIENLEYRIDKLERSNSDLVDQIEYLEFEKEDLESRIEELSYDDEDW